MFPNKVVDKRIILRPYEEEDIHYWQKWDIDSDIQVFMPESKNEKVSLDKQLKYLEECKNEKDSIYWSVVWKENNQLIGTISVTEINKHHGTGKIGVVIGEKDYWGKGIASEAITLVLEFVSSNLGLRRIIAEYEKGNEGMQKALENSGFKKECICKESRIKNNKPIDTIRYYILLRYS